MPAAIVDQFSRRVGDPNEAGIAEYGRRAVGHLVVQLAAQYDDKVGLAYSNLQLAELRMETENLADIFDYAEQGQRGFEELGNRIGQIMARATTARAFFHVGLLDEAEEGLREVITAATAKELPTVAGDSMIRLGMLLAEKGRLADAERQLLESEKLFRGARYRRKLVEAILQLAALRIEMAELKPKATEAF